MRNKVILFLSLLLIVSTIKAQTPSTIYNVPTRSSMESYFGKADKMFVVEDTAFYATCQTCTVDNISVFSGAGGRKWIKIANSKADSAAFYSLSRINSKTAFVATIPKLENYTDSSTTVIVQDSLRGGVFNYVTSATPDSGTVFKRYNSGYWQRQITNATINAAWFGLHGDGVTDDKAILDNIFSVASGKKVIFPANKTFYISNALYPTFSNAFIDFNGCTLALGASNPTNTRILTLAFCDNSTIVNLNFDGDKGARSSSSQDIALWIDSTSNLTLDNLYFHDVDYHPIVISPGTPNLYFGAMRFYNNYGAGNNSDIYVSNDSLSNVTFKSLVGNLSSYQQTDLLYDHGWNVNVGSINATNYDIVATQRTGAGFIGSIIGQNCGGLLMVQSDGGTSNNQYDYPSLTVNSIIGRGIKGESSIQSAIYVDLANNVKINKADIQFDSTSAYNQSGVKISGYYNTGTQINNLELDNITVSNAKLMGVYCAHTRNPILLKNLVVNNTPTGIQTDSVTASIAVLDYTFNGVTSNSSVTGVNYLTLIKTSELHNQTYYDAIYHSQTYYDSRYNQGIGSINYIPYWNAAYSLTPSTFYMLGGFMYGTKILLSTSIISSTTYAGMYWDDTNASIRWATGDGTFALKLFGTNKTLRYYAHPSVSASNLVIPDISQVDSAAHSGGGMNSKLSYPTKQTFTDSSGADSSTLISVTGAQRLIAATSDTVKTDNGIIIDTTLNPGKQTLILDSNYVDSTVRNIAWSKAGNAGTVAGTDFFGTTDNKPILLKINNIVAGFMGSGSYDVSFGDGSLPYSTTTFHDNSAFGHNAQHSIGASATGNSSTGAYSQFSLVSGSRNNSFAGASLFGNISGIGNNSFGNTSLYQAISDYNSAFGDSSLYDLTTGKFDIGLGQRAGNGVTTQSNTLYVSDSTTHMHFNLDSASGTAPNVIGKDGSGNEHVYANTPDTANPNFTGTVTITDGTHAGLTLTKTGTSAGNTLLYDDGNAHFDASTGGRAVYFSGNGSGYAMIIRNAANTGNLIGIKTNGTTGFNTISPTSTVTVAGSFSTAYVAESASYTATISDHTIDCTANTFTVTLPDATGISGREYVIKNSGAGVITLACTSTQTIDGVTTKTLNTQYSGLTAQSTGANWIVIGTF